MDAVDPSRPHRPRTRDSSFLLSNKLDNMRRRKPKLEYRFKMTGSAKDFHTFKTHLRLYLRELQRASPFYSVKHLAVTAMT